jgi:hypothetical protein
MKKGTEVLLLGTILCVRGAFVASASAFERCAANIKSIYRMVYFLSTKMLTPWYTVCQ